MTTVGGYRLVLARDDWLDAAAFEQSLAEAAATSSVHDRAIALSAALGWWRGAVFGSAGDHPRVLPARTKLEELRRAAIEDLAAAMLDCGRVEPAILLLDASRDELRYRERPVELLMRAHAVQGRLTDALRAYERFRVELRDDIGVVPSVRLRELERQLIADDDAGRPNRRSPAGAGVALEAPGCVLPRPLTALVGRDDEVRAILGLVRSQRLLTLVGTGGAGKTRLAIEVADSMRSEFADGPWFAALANLSDPHLVVPTIAQAMGRFDPLAANDPNGTLDHLIRSIGDARVLLVVDNCEHVRGGCAAAVARLANACPALTIIATSREQLRVLGEHVVDVSPLGVPAGDTADDVIASAAGALFVDRARAASARFELDDLSAPSVAALCRRLDGLPLALELAAARARSMTPAQLLVGVDRTPALLGGAHSAVPHHESLREALTWSYDLLEPAERLLFRRLAVFRGGFRFDAATAAAAELPPDDVPSLLASLVDKSLVIADAGPRATLRFRLLEVVRDFATRQLDEHAEADDTQQRHLRHFLDRCAQISMSDRGTDPFGDLAIEIDNIRAAIAFAERRGNDLDALTLVNRYPCWQDLGLLGEYDQLLTAELGSARRPTHRALPITLLAASLQSLSITRTYRGDVAGADASITTLTALSTRHPDDFGVRGHASFAAGTRSYLFRYDELSAGHEHMSRAQEHFDRAGHPDAYPAANQLFAAVLFGERALHGIDRSIDDALLRVRTAHGPVLEITVHALAACWQTLWNDHDEIDACNRLLDTVLVLHSGWEGNLLKLIIAHARESAGDPHGAAAAALDYLGFARASGLRIFVADVVRSTARLAHRRRPDQALRLWAAADRLAAETGLRDVTILRQHDDELRRSTAATIGTEATCTLGDQGRRWTLIDAIDSAETLLQELAHAPA